MLTEQLGFPFPHDFARREQRDTRKPRAGGVVPRAPLTRQPYPSQGTDASSSLTGFWDPADPAAMGFFIGTICL